MIFSVLSDEMSYGLNMIAHAVPARSVVPATEGVYIDTDTDHLILTATNGEMTIKAQVPAMIEEEGCGLLPAKLFSEVVRKQESGQIRVVMNNDTFAATVTTRRSKTNMMGMDTENFPQIAAPEKINTLIMSCARFRSSVGKVLFAVGEDEGRKILTGVLMEAHADHVIFVGLDGFRLSMQKMKADNVIPSGKECIKCVIPGMIMNEVTRMIPDDENEMLSIVFSSSHVMFSFGTITLYGTLLAGEFIDYRKILPATAATTITIPVKELGYAIDRCALIARETKNNLVAFSVNKAEDGGEDGQLVITANAECGNARDEINVGIQGESLNISFNAKYLNEMIHNINDEMVTMCFNTNVSPCLVKPLEGDDYRFLILPVRVYGR